MTDLMEKWRVTFPAPFTNTEIEYLEATVGLTFYWLDDDDEWVVAFKVLAANDGGSTVLQVTRRREDTGLDFRLVSSMREWDAEMLANARDEVLQALTALARRRCPENPLSLSPVSFVPLPEPNLRDVALPRPHGLYPLVLPLRGYPRRTRPHQDRAPRPGRELTSYVLIQFIIGSLLYLSISLYSSDFLRSSSEILSSPSVVWLRVSLASTYTWLTAVAVLVIALAATAASLRATPNMNRYTRARAALAGSSATVVILLAGTGCVAITIAGLKEAAPSSSEKVALTIFAVFTVVTTAILALTLGAFPDRPVRPEVDEARAAVARTVLERRVIRDFQAAVAGCVVWCLLLSFSVSLVVGLLYRERITNLLQFVVSSGLLLSFWTGVLIFLPLVTAGILIGKTIIRTRPMKSGLQATALLIFAAVFITVGIVQSSTLQIVLYFVYPLTFSVVALLPGIGDFFWGRAVITSALDNWLDEKRRTRAQDLRASLKSGESPVS